MALQPWRLDARWERWFDRALVVALLLPVVALVVSGGATGVWLFSAAEIAPLLWRRRHAVASFAAVALVSGVQAVALSSPVWGQVAFPVAIYSVARFASVRAGWAALGVGTVGTVVASLRWAYGFDQPNVETVVAYLLTVGLLTALPWTLGTLGRIRAAYVDALVERGARLERELRQQAELAALDERARIAREMHDVVAHGLSTIVVQADGARYAAAADPDLAVETLATISATGRQSLTEMRKMLGLLRAEESGTRPVPTLADLPALVEEVRSGGTPLDARLPADLGDVPEGVGLTGYRVVQEALTNVRKHAGPGARVELSVDLGEQLEVRVRDDGRGAGVPAGEGGLGLLGMRERVAIHGGTLHAAPLPSGGFEVHARIPR